QLWRLRLLVRIVDPGEVRDVAAARPLVEALYVPPFALGQRRRDVNLDEARAQAPHVGSRRLVWRDQRAHNEDAVVLEPAREETDTPDVFVAFRPAEPGLRERRAHDVAVQQLDSPAGREQTLHDLLRDRGFPGAGQAREPDHRWRGQLLFHAVDRRGLGKRLENDAAAGDVEVVDDDEAPGRSALVDQVERERRLEDQRALGDLISADC